MLQKSQNVTKITKCYKNHKMLQKSQNVTNIVKTVFSLFKALF